jgi:hypothetical protein
MRFVWLLDQLLLLLLVPQVATQWLSRYSSRDNAVILFRLLSNLRATRTTPHRVTDHPPSTGGNEAQALLSAENGDRFVTTAWPFDCGHCFTRAVRSLRTEHLTNAGGHTLRSRAWTMASVLRASCRAVVLPTTSLAHPCRH